MRDGIVSDDFAAMEDADAGVDAIATLSWLLLAGFSAK